MQSESREHAVHGTVFVVAAALSWPTARLEPHVRIIVLL